VNLTKRLDYVLVSLVVLLSLSLCPSSASDSTNEVSDEPIAATRD